MSPNCIQWRGSSFVAPENEFLILFVHYDDEDKHLLVPIYRLNRPAGNYKNYTSLYATSIIFHLLILVFIAS